MCLFKPAAKLKTNKNIIGDYMREDTREAATASQLIIITASVKSEKNWQRETAFKSAQHHTKKVNRRKIEVSYDVMT